MPRNCSTAREVSELALESSKSAIELESVRQFEEKREEVVPLKKRKFIFQSLSSSPRKSSPHSKENDGTPESSGVVNYYSASANDCGPIVDTEHQVDEKNLDRVDRQEDGSQDFFGISLLADAACTNSAGGGESRAENGSGFADSCFLSKKISKEDLASAEISTEGTAACISALPTEEPDGLLGTDHSSSNVLLHGMNVEGKGLLSGSGVMLEDLRKKEEDGKDCSSEFTSQNDRFHWDLNTTMDMWEHPSDKQSPDVQNTTSDVTSEDLKAGTFVDNKTNLEFLETQIGLAVKCDDSASKGDMNGVGVKSSGEMFPIDPVGNGCDSDRKYSSADPEADNSSQYEDGEVRESIEHVDYDPDYAENLGYENEYKESILHSWEDYDGEDLTPEHIECESGDGNSLGSKDEVISRPGSTRAEKLPLETKVKEASQPSYMDRNVSGSDNRRVNVSRCRNIGRDSVDQTSSEEAFIRKLGLRRNCDVGNFNPRYNRESGYARGRYYANNHPSDRNSIRPDSRKYQSPASLRGRNVERGGHWHHDRRRSPVDRDEAFDMPTHRRLSRERSPERRLTFGRGRGRSMNYGPRMDRGSPRRRYHSPVPDDMTIPQPRRRSFSPMEEKGDSYSQRSRSPSFRPDPRMQRGRFIHHRPRFSAEHSEEVKSIPRSHGSQPYDSRRINRNDGVFHSSAREQRFPNSFDTRRNRFESGDSNRNYRGSGRGRGGRGLRYDRINDDREKHDYEYEELHRTRHYDSRVKRLPYNEDGFSAPRTDNFRFRKDGHEEGHGIGDASGRKTREDGECDTKTRPFAAEEGEDNRTSQGEGAS